MSQMVKNLPTMQEVWVQSPNPKDPLEKEMATCSSNLAWKIPWTEIPGELLFVVSQSDVTEATNTHTRSLDGPQRVGPVMNSRSRACYESLPMGVFS